MKASHLVLFGCASLWLAAPVRSADIVALCIGNDAYVRSVDVLDTPVADASLMSETLRAIPGVSADDVILLPNGTRESIRTALRQFREKSRGAKLSIVFYSGHGMEDQPTGYDRAETFLLPVDAVIESVDQLPDRAVGLGEVLDVFKGLGPGGRVVVLDCCRTGAPSATNALAGAGKNVTEDLDVRVARALGQAELTEGTLVSFSAGPGRKAAAFLKDTDAYSPFTHFLAKGIREEGGDLFGILSRATATTREATGGRQIPRVRFDGDPSLISAVRLGASRPVVVAPVVTPLGNSAEMAALLARVEAAEKAREEAERRAAMANQPAPAIPAPMVVPSSLAPDPMVKTDPVTAPAFSASSGMEGSRAGEVREFGGIEMVWCPPGEFLMGSPASEADRQDDETEHRVILTKGFWLAKTEATQAQWQSVMGSNPSEFTGVDLPVESVSWDDVQGWLQKMNQKTSLPSGWAWSLPTEAQWEYACHAGTETPFSFGSVLNGKEANCNGNYPYGTSVTGPYLEKTAKVGSYAANAWGLHDMHGNVKEWCADYYGDYASGTATDPQGATSGSKRVHRGGGWSYDAQFCRAAIRNKNWPLIRNFYLGFRPALSSLPAR
jgi:formylglycine-generating enzyme